jgi:iron(III) transport system permease protein
VQTLATQFWNYQQNLSYAQAAPFALVIIGVAALPSIVLGRFFNRSAPTVRADAIPRAQG